MKETQVSKRKLNLRKVLIAVIILILIILGIIRLFKANTKTTEVPSRKYRKKQLKYTGCCKSRIRFRR